MITKAYINYNIGLHNIIVEIRGKSFDCKALTGAICHVHIVIVSQLFHVLLINTLLSTLASHSSMFLDGGILPQETDIPITIWI